MKIVVVQLGVEVLFAVSRNGNLSLYQQDSIFLVLRQSYDFQIFEPITVFFLILSAPLKVFPDRQPTSVSQCLAEATQMIGCKENWYFNPTHWLVGTSFSCDNFLPLQFSITTVGLLPRQRFSDYAICVDAATLQTAI